MPYAPPPPGLRGPTSGRVPETHGADRCLLPLRGLELRYAALIMLDQRFGLPRTIAELLDDLVDLGVRPAATAANKGLADALRWEVRRGRVERVAHGRYRLGVLPDTTRRRARRAVRLALTADPPQPRRAT